MNEKKLIENLKDNQYQHPTVKLGIGDDMAVINSHPQELLVSADTLLDGVHFDRISASPEQISYKAIAVNLSDMAAMGGKPESILVCVSFPKSIETEWLSSFIKGLKKHAKYFRIQIIGGDTTSWNGPLAISVTILGRTHRNGFITRSGAQAGDLIYVTGPLGGSLESGHHLNFKPRLQLAEKLMDCCKPSAMIDISDGLASDLQHICDASYCGAELIKQAIPINKNLSQQCSDDSIYRAMTDGEDFELCFTIESSKAKQLENLNFNLYQIGRMTSKTKAMIWSDGTKINFSGYEHKFGMTAPE